MVDVTRVQKLVDQLNRMSAAEMKLIARFGKVKDYSQDYLDLKEAMRSVVSMARNIHGIDVKQDFDAIEPIQFLGMIPNEVFTSEKRRLVAVGEKIIQRLKQLETDQKSTPAPQAPVADESSALPPPARRSQPQATPPAMAPPQLQARQAETPKVESAPARTVSSNGRLSPSSQEPIEPVARQAKPPVTKSETLAEAIEGTLRIFISESSETTATTDMKRCLVSAECELSMARGAKPGEARFSPVDAADQMRDCDGAFISLMPVSAVRMTPSSQTASNDGVTRFADNVASKQSQQRQIKSAVQLVQSGDNDLSDAAQAESTSQVAVQTDALVKNVLVELGIALSMFPDRTFFVVHESLMPALPGNIRNLVSLRTDGTQLSFEAGQKLVQRFKQPKWNS